MNGVPRFFPKIPSKEIELLSGFKNIRNRTNMDGYPTCYDENCQGCGYQKALNKELNASAKKENERRKALYETRNASAKKENEKRDAIEANLIQFSRQNKDALDACLDTVD